MRRRLFELAERMHRADVDVMADQMSARLWMDWDAYTAASPPSEVRSQIYQAVMTQTLVNLQRDPSKHKPYKLERFILPFGDDAVSAVENPEYAEALAREALIADAEAAQALEVSVQVAVTPEQAQESIVSAIVDSWMVGMTPIVR